MESSRLSPRSIDIRYGKAAEGHHFTRSQPTSLSEVDHEFLPRDALLLVFFANSEKQTIKSFTLFICGLAYIVVKVLASVGIMADVVEEFFKIDVIKVLLFSEFAFLENAPKALNQALAHVNHRLALD